MSIKGSVKYATVEARVEALLARAYEDGGCLLLPMGGVARHHYPSACVARSVAQAAGLPPRAARSIYEAHVLVAHVYLGPRPPGLEVRHLCGRGCEGCITPEHLAYGTRSENMVDTSRHGRSPSRALSDEDVRTARLMRSFGHSQQSVADALGVSQKTISNLERGVYLAHVA